MYYNVVVTRANYLAATKNNLFNTFFPLIDSSAAQSEIWIFTVLLYYYNAESASAKVERLHAGRDALITNLIIFSAALVENDSKLGEKRNTRAEHSIN
jgi:hypothetical protein